jgi:aerobic carbon-monoxide dehydrogenase medium subunit
MSLSPLATKKLKEYEYFAPTTLQEAASLLGQYDGQAVLLAGGTDVLPMMKFRALTPKWIINLKRIPNLDYIREEAGELRIGALTTISDLMASDLIKRRCLALYEASAVFSSLQIRNMATIGGNICRGSPSADTVPPLMSFDADLKLMGTNGERKVPLADFFKGARKNALDKEILTEVVIPLRKGKWGTAFAKLTRNSTDLAKLNCAVSIALRGRRCEDIRIVLGAVADRTVRAQRAENAARGREIEDGLVEEVARIVGEDITPITDARSTASYRKKASQVVVRRLIKEAVARSSA